MTFETGHARNIQHFEEMISFVVGYGGIYKPSNAKIALAALQAKLTDANAAMDGVMSAFGVHTSATNSRENTFAALRPLVTRMVNYFTSTGAERNEIEDAKGFKRKIDGKRASKPKVQDSPTPGTPPPVVHSSAQTSFTQEIEHFDNLVTLLVNHPLYNPNETDLQKASLQTYSDQLKAANTAVIDAYAAVSNQRLSRNVVLYADTDGMCDLAALVKNYVKAVFGGASPEYKQISKLRFKNEKP